MTLNLITDRTQDDVNRWRTLGRKGFKNMTAAEKAEWFSGMKGSYNATDLNRVGEALLYLAERFRGYSYIVYVDPKTDWSVNDIPTPEQLQHYLDNVAVIRGVMDVYRSTPLVPNDMDGLTYEDANDIEKILVDVEDIIKHVAASFRQSSAYMFISGNAPLPSLESDMGRTWKDLDAMGTVWSNWQVADWFLLLYGNLKAEGDVV